MMHSDCMHGSLIVMSSDISESPNDNQGFAEVYRAELKATKV